MPVTRRAAAKANDGSHGVRCKAPVRATWARPIAMHHSVIRGLRTKASPYAWFHSCLFVCICFDAYIYIFGNRQAGRQPYRNREILGYARTACFVCRYVCEQKYTIIHIHTHTYTYAHIPRTD